MPDAQENNIQRIACVLSLSSRVNTGDRVLVLGSADSDGSTVLVATRVLDADIGPESVRATSLLAVGASDKALAIESEIAVLSDLPALGLSVLGKVPALVGVGGVAENALTHAGAVNVGLLSILKGVKVEFAKLVDVECDLILGQAAVARGALVLDLESKAAVGSLEGLVVDFLVALGESNGVVACDFARCGGRDHTSGEDGGEEGREVHVDGIRGLTSRKSLWWVC